MEFLDREGPSIGITYRGSDSLPRALPTVEEDVRHRAENRKFSSRFSHVVLKICLIVLYVVTQLLECCFPRCFARRRLEEGSIKASQTLFQSWKGDVVKNWSRIVRYVGAVVMLLLVLATFIKLMPRTNPELLDAARRSESLLRGCYHHTDRLHILKEPALEVDAASLSSGRLPCGTPVERLKERLATLHLNHRSEAPFCLTAKHLNHSYAMLSRDDGELVSFMFNPDSMAPIGNEIMHLNVTSAFFPMRAPAHVVRPMAAWISFTDSSGYKQRKRFEQKMLHCILGAWEILSGEHYARFNLSDLE